MKIVIAAPKGGVGKTTSSIYVAAVLAAEGVPVTIVDADPQGSASEWAEARPIEGVEIEEAPTARLLRRALAEERPGVVIVDTAPGSPELMTIAVAAADVVTIPTRPGGQEPVAVAATLAAVPTGTPRGIVICAAPTGERSTTETATGWTEAGEVVLGVVPRRAAIASGPAGPLAPDGLTAYRQVLDRTIAIATEGDTP